MQKRPEEIIQKVIKILSDRLNPQRIFLFGSRAKGKHSKHADFDFAVDLVKPSLSLQRKVNEEIEQIAGLYKFDIVYLQSIDKEFKEIVLQTGKVIYEK